MREGGLVERIASATAPLPEARSSGLTPQPRLLNDVARALREAAETTAKKRAQELAKDQKPKPVENAHKPALDEPAGLPQILQNPVIPGEAKTARGERAKEQIIAPAVLVSGLLAVALMLSASVVDLTRVPGLSWLADKPRPRLTGLVAQQPGLVSAFDPADGKGGAVPLIIVPPLSPEEQALLERCETMIAHGDMTAARKELARAANEGSANARFALAETYDPNVLAAWGLRERVADVGTALTLYKQALAEGDNRASARIDSLQMNR